jgi:hypothetical protein
VDALLMQKFFEVSAKAGALERLGKEATLEFLVLEMVAHIGEALLAVLKCVDN